jgi:hypothetical protein
VLSKSAAAPTAVLESALLRASAPPPTPVLKLPMVSEKAALVAVLVVSLVRIYPFGAVLFICYCAYLLYATWWGYRLWLLNT